METKSKILFLDNEEHTLFGMKALFRRDYDVFIAQNKSEAEEFFRLHDDIRMVICDQKMPDQKGTDFLAELRVTHPKILRILFTGSLECGTLYEAINKSWVFKCVEKPLDIEELKSIIEEADREYEFGEANKKQIIKLLMANRFLQDRLNNKKRQ